MALPIPKHRTGEAEQSHLEQGRHEKRAYRSNVAGDLVADIYAVSSFYSSSIMGLTAMSALSGVAARQDATR